MCVYYAVFSWSECFNFWLKYILPSYEQVGGTILSAKLAKERGWAINIGGGFHHCCANEGGGFCAYADITLAIQFAYTRLAITRYCRISLPLFNLQNVFYILLILIYLVPIGHCLSDKNIENINVLNLPSVSRLN